MNRERGIQPDPVGMYAQESRTDRVLAMWLDGDNGALAAYLAGDRSSPTVAEYFSRCGVPLPKQPRAA